MPSESAISADVIGGAAISQVTGGFNVWTGCGCCEPVNFPCGTCSIPKKDLTLSWFGGPGDGSTPLIFNGTNNWQSVCTNQLIFQLLCNTPFVELRVIYFITGACPTGQRQYCSTQGGNPLRLVQTGLTCGNSFLLTCNVTGVSCPDLDADGYTGFSVSV